LEEQDYDNYEVLYIHEGKTSAEGKNIGIEKSTGDIVIFFDDDTIIPKHWISKAVKLLKIKNADIVGGPNLLMPNSSLSEKISDFLLKSKLTSGDRKKFKLGLDGFSSHKNFSTCNIAIKKSVFDKVGKFSTDFPHTEDMEFLYLCELYGYKLYYAGDLFVYHKRRSFPLKHLKRLFEWGYGNIQIALAYPKLFKRIDIIGSLSAVVAGVVSFILFPFWTLLLFLLSLPISLHVLSYGLGSVVGLFNIKNWSKRGRCVI